MKRNSLYKIWFVAALLVMTSLSLLAWTKLSAPVVQPVKKKEVRQAEPEIAYDPALLNKLEMLAAKLDAGEAEFFLQGRYSYLDGKDSTTLINGVEYLLSKRGQEMYCRFGDTETLNTADVYIFVDHSQKKIMLSGSKKIGSAQGMPELGKLVKQLRTERYELISGKSGQMEYVGLVNPLHISCKSYKLLYDPSGFIPKRIEVIVNDPVNPENSSFDKQVTLEVTRVAKTADSDLLLSSRLVKKQGDIWISATAFKDYELIML